MAPWVGNTLLMHSITGQLIEAKLCWPNSLYPESPMVTVTFTPNLQRHVSSPPRELTATTVADALQQIFAENQTLAGYILDDQHRLRKNITIFVDGTMIQDRNTLSDPLQPTSDVQVLQALSGG